jgi:hypothetical protein
MNFILMTDLHRKMSAELEQIRNDNPSPQKWAMESIPVVQKYLRLLKEHLMNHPFQRRSEEILFFKEVKPEFMCELIFFTEIFNWWRDYPFYDEYKERKDFWLNCMQIVERFFTDNKAFCRYLVQEEPFLDAQYFVRRPKNMFFSFGLPKELDACAFYGDPEFSTSHDYRMAKVIAFARLRGFIREQLKETERTKNAPCQIREDFKDDNFHSFLAQCLRDFWSTEAGGKASFEEAGEYLQKAIQAELSRSSGLRVSHLHNGEVRLLNSLETTIRKFQAEVAAENEDIEYD